MTISTLDGMDWAGSVVTPDPYGFQLDLGTVSASPGNGAFSGSCILLGSSSAGTYVRPLADTWSSATSVIRFWVKMVAVGSPGDLSLLDIRSTGGTDQLRLMFRRSDDRLSIQRAGSTLLASGTINLDDGNWHHVELHTTIDGSAGVVYCWVDSALAFSATAQNTQAAAWTAHRVRMVAERTDSTNRWTNYFDDLLVETGYTAGTQLGQHRIYSLVPNANTAVTFTPSTGTDNFATVDDLPTDSADSNSTTTLNNQDLMAVTSLGFTPAEIYGVRLSAFLRRTAGTSSQGAALLKNGSTTSQTSAAALTSTTLQFYAYHTLNPDTSAAWTASDIDSSQIGYKCTATTGSGNVVAIGVHLAVAVSIAADNSLTGVAASIELTGKDATLTLSGGTSNATPMMIITMKGDGRDQQDHQQGSILPFPSSRSARRRCDGSEPILEPQPAAGGRHIQIPGHLGPRRAA